MSRIPRFQEHLKTGFTAEAASAARYRAYADRARADGMPNVAQRWLRLAFQVEQIGNRQGLRGDVLLDDEKPGQRNR